ncbi:GNAT family N-acetyltransferase [Streptomyces sp. NPDC091289]|uniref:GNAT family N-acetyltransferase n=1 Tax=Streptomyces sp. NPDC091289 TaxID=3365989 RepID=UPI00382A3AEC
MVGEATPADLDAIVALHTEARATYYRDHRPAEEYEGAAELARSREGWAGAVGRPGATVLCAEAGDELVGVAAFAEREGSVYLSQLHVAPARWRSGVGAALHAACLDAWQRAGFRTARLEVFEHNARARSFYARHGWAPDPDRPRDGTHLLLRLDVPVAGIPRPPSAFARET